MFFPTISQRWLQPGPGQGQGQGQEQRKGEGQRCWTERPDPQWNQFLRVFHTFGRNFIVGWESIVFGWFIKWKKPRLVIKSDLRLPGW